MSLVWHPQPHYRSQLRKRTRPTVWSVAEAGAAFHRVLYKFYVTAVLN